MKKITFALDELSSIVSSELIPLLQTKNIFAFRGPLGAGKTTMIREFLAQLGMKDVVTSPTFTYVNMYDCGKKTCYHFDLYRLSAQDEFFQLGFDEYLADEEAICVIEWPEVVETLLSDPALRDRVCVVQLGYAAADEGRRLLVLE